MLRGAALVALGRADDGLPLLADAVAADGDVNARSARRRATSWRARTGAPAGWTTPSARWTLHVPADTGIDLTRARLELYGWIEVRRERYPIASRHFLDALDTLKRSPHRDAAMHASLLYALVSIALDTLDLKLFARVRRDIDASTWSPGLQPRWAALRRMRAIVELLDGSAAEAWRLADEALFQSAAGSQRVAALVTAAQVARAAGETFTPDRLVHKAAGIAANVDWGALDREGRGVLLEVIRQRGRRRPRRRRRAARALRRAAAGAQLARRARGRPRRRRARAARRGPRSRAARAVAPRRWPTCARRWRSGKASATATPRRARCSRCSRSSPTTRRCTAPTS